MAGKLIDQTSYAFAGSEDISSSLTIPTVSNITVNCYAARTGNVIDVICSILHIDGDPYPAEDTLIVSGLPAPRICPNGYRWIRDGYYVGSTIYMDTSGNLKISDISAGQSSQGFTFQYVCK